MIYFLIYLFLEVSVSMNIASSIGTLATFAELIVSALIGFIIMANFRVTLVQSMQALMNKSISMEAFQRLNVFTILGAILLILPGFLGDIIGICLQFSFFATLFANKVLHKTTYTENQNFSEGKNDEIIDVEIIDDSHTRLK
ncbi:MAG: FxsA family protein [Sulfurospirillaceae bacterium]|nr:FxsA family protein [Sulfurospirillaceae bacterium]